MSPGQLPVFPSVSPVRLQHHAYANQALAVLPSAGIKEGPGHSRVFSLCMNNPGITLNMTNRAGFDVATRLCLSGVRSEVTLNHYRCYNHNGRSITVE